MMSPPTGTGPFAESALREKKRRIRTLRNGSSDAQALANQLEASEDQPHPHLADPTQALKTKEIFTGSLLELTGAHQPVLVLTLVPPAWLIPEEELPKINLRQMFNTLRQSIRRLRLEGVCVISALDVTYDVCDKAYQLHLHGCVFGQEKEALAKALHRIFPSSKEVYRPVYLQELNDPIEQVSYMLKTWWVRKERYQAINGRIQSNTLPLKGPQLRQLLVFFSRHRIADLFFLMGARRNRDGSFRLTANRTRAGKGGGHGSR